MSSVFRISKRIILVGSLGALLYYVFSHIVWSTPQSFKLLNHERLYRIQDNGLYGFIDSTGAVIIQPQYPYVSDFSDDGLALVITDIERCGSLDGNVAIHYGVIDTQNNIIVDTTRIFIDSMCDSLYFKFSSKKLSFNEKLEECLEPVSSIQLAQDTILIHGHKRLQYNYIDIRKDTIVIENILWNNEIRGFNDGRILLPSTHGTHGDFMVYDNNGNIRMISDKYVNSKTIRYSDIDASSCYFDRFSIEGFYDGKMWLRQPTQELLLGDSITVKHSCYKWLLVDTCMEVISQILTLDPQIGFVYMGCGLTICHDGNADTISVLDDNLCKTWITGSKFIWHRAREGYFATYGNWNGQTGWTFVDSALQIRSPQVFENVGSFHRGLAPIKINNKWGFINQSFIICIPCQFDYCDDFDNELAYFRKNGLDSIVEGYINRSGKVVWSHKTPRPKNDYPKLWHGHVLQQWMEDIYPNTFKLINWIVAAQRNRLQLSEYKTIVDSLAHEAEYGGYHVFYGYDLWSLIKREFEVNYSTEACNVKSLYGFSEKEFNLISDKQQLKEIMKALEYYNHQLDENRWANYPGLYPSLVEMNEAYKDCYAAINTLHHECFKDIESDVTSSYMSESLLTSHIIYLLNIPDKNGRSNRNKSNRLVKREIRGSKPISFHDSLYNQLYYPYISIYGRKPLEKTMFNLDNMIMKRFNALRTTCPTKRAIIEDAQEKWNNYIQKCEKVILQVPCKQSREKQELKRIIMNIKINYLQLDYSNTDLLTSFKTQTKKRMLDAERKGRQGR